MPSDTPSTSPPSRGETVTQSVVEELLAQVGASDAPANEAHLASPGRAPAGMAERCVFPPHSHFGPTLLRKLRIRHENFIRALAARLSLHLRLELGLQLTSFDTLQFQKFIEGISVPAHLTMIGFEPLDGVCLLDVPPRLAEPG